MLADNIRSARTLAGETQAELAEAVFVTSSAISQYETGRTRPTSKTLRPIADHYKTTVDELENGEWPELESRGKRVKDEFPGLDAKGKVLLRRVWDAVRDYVDR